MLQTNTGKDRTSITHGFEGHLVVAPDMKRLTPLVDADREEMLAFLAVRPVHTVVMSSYIVDNGVVSVMNRGSFYGYRNRQGDLEGVALIGHSTLVEARSDEALKAFALAARRPDVPVHLIMASGTQAESFHAHLKGDGSSARLRCPELLFEAAFPFPVQMCELDIRAADLGQLEQIASAQAEIAYQECGVDPILRDREGFLERVTRRIEQGRIFTVFEAGSLIFKADIIAETAETVYLEGIYVHPEYRGKGIGAKCLSALTQQLLGRVNNVCLLSNTEFTAAHRMFEKAGYRRTDQCITLFV